MYKVKIYPETKSPSLFKNKFLELLTRTHPLVITIMYLIIGVLLIRTFMVWYPEVPAWKIISVCVSGYFTWTFAEYMMHRFLYHKSGDASYDTGFKYVFHGIHHEYPDDEERLVLPPIPSLLLAGIILSVFYLIMGGYALLFGTGFLWGYLTYMNIHFMVHRIPPSKHFTFWWRHHQIHHFQQHDRAFGVTTSFWDRVFRTMPEGHRKTVEIELHKKGGAK